MTSSLLGTGPFPMLFPTNELATEYKGFITFRGESYPVMFTLPEGNLQRITIHTTGILSQVIRQTRSAIEQRLRQCRNLSNFLCELRDILESVAPVGKSGESSGQDGTLSRITCEGKLSLPSARFLRCLVENLDQAGWDRLQEISADLRQVQLQITDAGQRVHFIGVRLPVEFPDQPPQCLADFPEPLDVTLVDVESPQEWFRKVIQQAQSLVQRYQRAWTVLDEIDRKLWVLEPRDKPYRTLTRRIALEKLCSVEFTLVSHDPASPPLVRLYGSDRYTESIRERLRLGPCQWDVTDRSFCDNFQAYLGVPLPSPVQGNTNEQTIECGICYSFQVDDQVPDQMCSNDKCSQPFHGSCLVEWLRTDPSSRQSFNIIFGTCPYCSEEISINVSLWRS
ncbi:hypothetical protein IWQ62_000355 [Dispira parvispora]|uniref:E3 ubiquitin-protein ligase FANCL n=1 Tax=Dispira parvispora TaxID=1520584 RepID=A0A9W8AUX7_9FUNG|nr:hypothetical protein IWQ62_000355 [Dispira parvispora]